MWIRYSKFSARVCTILFTDRWEVPYRWYLIRISSREWLGSPNQRPSAIHSRRQSTPTTAPQPVCNCGYSRRNGPFHGAPSWTCGILPISQGSIAWTISSCSWWCPRRGRVSAGFSWAWAWSWRSCCSTTSLLPWISCSKVSNLTLCNLARRFPNRDLFLEPTTAWHRVDW